jgi:SAM-dependent methyltransferase
MAWFTNWFGTKYYKLLYRHRDEAEAHAFLDRLMNSLDFPHGSKIIDVGCGQGRHSRYLASKGYDVTGLDIDEDNIAEAKKSENKCLRFVRHDMRQPFPAGDAGLVLNVFTSFGYFENDAENQEAIRNMATALKEDGVLVIDFFNAEQVEASITGPQLTLPDGSQSTERGEIYTEIQRGNVDFCIHKKIQNGFVVKTIDISDKGEKHTYQEKVRLLTREDFERYFLCCGLRTEQVYGSYTLQPFDIHSSPRLLLIVKKTSP